MAITTRTKPIEISYDRYRGVTPFQERAFANAQQGYNNLRDSLAQQELLVQNYNKHNAQDATNIEKEYSTKLNELTKSLRHSGDIDKVTKQFLTLNNQFKTDERIKDLGILKDEYNLRMKEALSAKDADTRQRAIAEIDKVFSSNKRLENGKYDLSPAEGLTFYDLPNVASAAKQYAGLAKADSNSYTSVNGKNIKTVVSPDGTRTYHVVKQGSQSGIDKEEVYDNLDDIILNDPTVQGYLNQVERRGGEELKNQYINQFKSQLGGISDLVSYDKKAYADKIIGTVDNTKKKEGSDAEAVTRAILENPYNAGTNQIAIPNSNQFKSFSELKENRNASKKALKSFRDNIVSKDSIQITGIPLPGGNNKMQTIPLKYNATKIDINNLPDIRTENGQIRKMTVNEANRYNILAGQEAKADRDFGIVKNEVLKELGISNESYSNHERFLESSQREQEQILGSSYNDYVNTTKQYNSNPHVEFHRPIKPFKEWSHDLYKRKFDFDIEEIDEAFEEKYKEQTYKTVNRRFVTVEGMKENLGGTTFNKTTPMFKTISGTVENRSRRYAESPQDVLANANNIIVQQADGKATTVNYQDEDFIQRVFQDSDMDLEKPITYKSLGTSWDINDGGIEKVQVSGTNEDGEKISNYIYVQDEDVDKISSFVSTGKPNSSYFVTDFKNQFKNSDVAAYSSHNGNIQYRFDKKSNGQFEYTISTTLGGSDDTPKTTTLTLSAEDAARTMAGIKYLIANQK